MNNNEVGEDNHKSCSINIKARKDVEPWSLHELPINKAVEAFLTFAASELNCRYRVTVNTWRKS